ncbi:MAG: hypothetical protein LPJ98_04870 [Cyclobacteriaceae bacterium]|nr:hypothetical protein [Cyclobacteriaceae bacterium]
MEKVYAKAILFALQSVLFLASIAYADGYRYEDKEEVGFHREIILDSEATPSGIFDNLINEEPEKFKLIFNNSYEENQRLDFEEFEFSPGQ